MMGKKWIVHARLLVLVQVQNAVKCIKFQEELDSRRFPGPWTLGTLMLPTLRDGISSLKVTSPYMLRTYMSSAGV